MNLSEIIDSIPQLLMHFVPGYIALEIRRNSRQENKYNDRDLVILSITYSFIIGRLVFLINWFFKIKTETIVNEWDIIFNIVIAVLFGYAITIYPDTKLASFYRKLLKSNAEPYSNVWNFAMRDPKGAWGRVYLKEENAVYVGKIIRYTCDPDEKRKEILLSEYALYRISDNEVIDDYAGNKKVCVYINATDVKRIEIFKKEPIK